MDLVLPSRLVSALPIRPWLIVLATAVAACFGWLSTRNEPDLYQATTTVIVSHAVDRQTPTYSDTSIGGQLARPYAELLRMEPGLRRTAKALGDEEQWRLLRGHVVAELAPGSLLLRIRSLDPDPFRAKQMADEAARQWVAMAGTEWALDAVEDSRNARFGLPEQERGCPGREPGTGIRAK